MLRAAVPMATTQRSSSGRSRASCCPISAPIESPTAATGGSQTASIRPAASAAKSAIDQGGGAWHTVLPIPRLSNVVLRNEASKEGIWYSCQVLPSPPPPESQTMSGPSPNCS